jgi:hypothetical protein
MRSVGTAKASSLIQSNGNGQGSRDGSIVGLWHVVYTLPDGTLFFQSFEQFHSDGNEFEGADVGPEPSARELGSGLRLGQYNSFTWGGILTSAEI